MLEQLTISDQIQFFSVMVSSLVAVISIIIAIATLRQTNRISQDANRPYLVFYLDVVQVTSTVVSYLVLKNFGNTGAIIESIEHITEMQSDYGLEPFSDIKNHFIAPGQSITSACKFKEPYSPIELSIKYKVRSKSFDERFLINPSAFNKTTFSKVTPGGANNLEKIIAYSAQEMIRTRL